MVGADEMRTSEAKCCAGWVRKCPARDLSAKTRLCDASFAFRFSLRSKLPRNAQNRRRLRPGNLARKMGVTLRLRSSEIERVFRRLCVAGRLALNPRNWPPPVVLALHAAVQWFSSTKRKSDCLNCSQPGLSPRRPTRLKVRPRVFHLNLIRDHPDCLQPRLH